ncbi:MAG: hypothetical protein U0892_08750 [Pirellulales bacterium]
MTRDLHFHTRTTIDTLDYSGDGLNAGSKSVIASVGPRRRELPTSIPAELRLPEHWKNPRLAMPGVLCIEASSEASPSTGQSDWTRQCDAMNTSAEINRFPLVVLCDDSAFSARNIDNFVWTTFTRSNPAADIYGIGAFTQQKHFGVRGSLVIDARIKPHHAPPLVEDPEITARVDALATRGLPISKYL